MPACHTATVGPRSRDGLGQGPRSGASHLKREGGGREGGREGREEREGGWEGREGREGGR